MTVDSRAPIPQASWSATVGAFAANTAIITRPAPITIAHPREGRRPAASMTEGDCIRTG
jgi:hypothetical protein